jgi:hypothetical protein
MSEAISGLGGPAYRFAHAGYGFRRASTQKPAAHFCGRVFNEAIHFEQAP